MLRPYNLDTFLKKANDTNLGAKLWVLPDADAVLKACVEAGIDTDGEIERACAGKAVIVETIDPLDDTVECRVPSVSRNVWFAARVLAKQSLEAEPEPEASPEASLQAEPNAEPEAEPKASPKASPFDPRPRTARQWYAELARPADHGRDMNRKTLPPLPIDTASLVVRNTALFSQGSQVPFPTPTRNRRFRRRLRGAAGGAAPQSRGGDGQGQRNEVGDAAAPAAGAGAGAGARR